MARPTNICILGAGLRFGRLLILMLVGTTFTATGLAANTPEASALAEHQASWLTWSPPPECPLAQDIQRQVEQWLDGALPSDRGLLVKGQVHWTGQHWLTSVAVTLDGVTREREVQVPTCSDAADFVALAVVLAIDPDNPQGDEGNEAPLPEATPTEQFEDAEYLMGPAAAPRDQESTSPHRPEKQGLGGLVGAGAVIATGALPGVRGGLELYGGIFGKHWQGRLEARALLPAKYEAAGAAAPITFSLLVGRVVGCYLWSAAALAFGPCLGFEAGALFSDQEGGGPEREQVITPWLAVAPGAEINFSVAKHVGFVAGAQLNIPLAPARLELDDGSEAHQTKLGVQGNVGVRIFWGRK